VARGIGSERLQAIGLLPGNACVLRRDGQKVEFPAERRFFNATNNSGSHAEGLYLNQMSIISKKESYESYAPA
jgi:hypothetical protein